MAAMSTARKFLAPAARQGDGRGYLSRPERDLGPAADEPEQVARIAERTAMCDEPECIGPAIVDAYTELARTYDQLRHQVAVERAREDRKRLSVEARMADVQRRARLHHVDMSHELHICRKMLVRAKQEAVVARLERLEGRLDGV